METEQEIKEDRNNLLLSFYLSFFCVLVLWLIKVLEVSLGAHFYWLGVYPRSLHGLLGIFTSSLIHKDFFHLGSNSLPLFMGIFMCFYYYRRIAFEIFTWVYFLSGIWVWLFARPHYHIGASGFIYGILSFLFFSGIIRRSPRLMTVSLIIIFMYGGMIWGVLPIEKGVSWESHALGALSGIILAIYFSKKGKLNLNNNSNNALQEWHYHSTDTSISPKEYNYEYKPKENKD
ncbi:MAG TPA: rhomboid family intramembrane serine protease [Bacteroidetes bacterium]|nr:rhomboid family intramembrane serine protease [Bacteroidota bacterium]